MILTKAMKQEFPWLQKNHRAASQHERVLLRNWEEPLVDAILFERDDGEIRIRIEGVGSAEIANADGRVAKVIAVKNIALGEASALSYGLAGGANTKEMMEMFLQLTEAK